MHRLGVFFGWHTGGQAPVPPAPFFFVELRDSPIEGGGNGQVTVFPALIEEGDENKGGGLTYCSSTSILSRPVLRPGAWHPLRIRVLDHRISLDVDDGEPGEVTMAKLQRGLPRGADSLNPRGALGLWAWSGFGYFRNATIKALLTQEGTK
jgi:hypothetical protein